MGECSFISWTYLAGVTSGGRETKTAQARRMTSRRGRYKLAHNTSILEQIHDLVGREARRMERARLIAEAIRSARGYRWVGIYEVTKEEIAAVGWTGTEAPTHPRFPITQGLYGAAVESRAPVVVGDVREDPRYLTTFGSTRSEIVVPVMDAAGRVTGLIDVESEHHNAFHDEDMQFLQSCAGEILPQFRRREG